MTTTSSRVHVALAKNSYDILIGHDLFTATAEDLSVLLAEKQVVIITDANIAPLHLQATEKALAEFARQTVSFILPAGEASKSFGTYEQLVNDILGLPIDRQTVLVALGGGVIGDLAGFAAASLLRGLDFIQIPTSLLALRWTVLSAARQGLTQLQEKIWLGRFISLGWFLRTSVCWPACPHAN